jgi:type VI protein secretion system component VasK
MTTELREALNAVARRFRSVRLWSLLAACCLAWAVIGVGLAFAIASTSEGVLPEYLLLGSFLTLTLATALVCGFVALRCARDPRWVARRIEAEHPELGTGLLAALEAASAEPEGRLGFLQSVVIRNALAHRQARGWDETVPTWTVRGARVAAVVAFTALVLVATMLIGQNRSRAVALAEIAHAADGIEVQVDPGDTSIERGSPLWSSPGSRGPSLPTPGWWSMTR